MSTLIPFIAPNLQNIYLNAPLYMFMIIIIFFAYHNLRWLDNKVKESFAAILLKNNKLNFIYLPLKAHNVLICFPFTPLHFIVFCNKAFHPWKHFTYSHKF